MTVVALLDFAAVVAAVASRLLPAAGWVRRSPRLGLAAWCSVLGARA